MLKTDYMITECSVGGN